MDSRVNIDEILKKNAKVFFEAERLRKRVLAFYIVFVVGAVTGFASVLFNSLVLLGVPVSSFSFASYVPKDPVFAPLFFICGVLAVGAGDIFLNKAHKKIVPLLMQSLGNYSYFRSIDDAKKIDGERVGDILDRAANIPSSDKENSILDVILDKESGRGFVICSPQLSRASDMIAPRIVFASITCDNPLSDIIITSTDYGLENYKSLTVADHINKPYKLFYAQKKNIDSAVIDDCIDHIYNYVSERFHGYEFAISFYNGRCNLCIKCCKVAKFASLFRHCEKKDSYNDVLSFYQKLIECMESIKSRRSVEC